YARLVFDLDDAESRHELLDGGVFLVVEGGAAEGPDRQRPVGRRPAWGPVAPGLGARPDGPLGGHLPRLGQRELLPAGAVRVPVLDVVLAERAVGVALRGLPLGTETAARDRARRIALDVGDLAALDVDELATTDRAVRTDRLDHVVGVVDPR